MRRMVNRLAARSLPLAGWARRPALPLLAVLVGVAVAAVLAISTSAEATTTYKLTLETQGAHGGVSLSSTTCTAAAATLKGKATGTRYPLAVAPAHFPSLNLTDVALTTNASTCTTLVLTGSATVFGKSVAVLVVGAWSSATATTPTFSVAIDFTSVGLGQLLTSAGGSNVGATFSHAWLAATTSSGGSSVTVTPSATTGALAAIKQFFTGFQGNAVNVAGSGLSFVGELASTGDLSAALSHLHVSNVQVAGSLVGTLSNFSTSSPPSASTGFTVSASFGLNIPNLPGWLSLPPSTAFTRPSPGTARASGRSP